MFLCLREFIINIFIYIFQLDKLFAHSILSEEYHSSVVTLSDPGWGLDFKRPKVIVHCWLALRPTDQLTEKVGTAFIGGLIHHHGKVWLGNYTIDIQSIGFQCRYKYNV